MRRVLITRPRQEAESLAAALAAKGFHLITEPLLRIEPLPQNTPELEAALARRPAALLVTSKRAIDAAAHMSPVRDILVFPVGEATARHAAALGYACAEPSETAKALAAQVEKHFQRMQRPRLLYLRGEYVSGDIASELEWKGFSVDSVVLYRAIPASEFSHGLLDQFAQKAITDALFFSLRTAGTYLSLVERHGLTEAHRSMHAVCISEAVAEPLRMLPWHSVSVAQKPDMRHMQEALEAAF
jgi:uroporphyrinogen-III synthase